jgi:hypothetical protein
VCACMCRDGSTRHDRTQIPQKSTRCDEFLCLDVSRQVPLMAHGSPSSLKFSDSRVPPLHTSPERPLATLSVDACPHIPNEPSRQPSPQCPTMCTHACVATTPLVTTAHISLRSQPHVMSSSSQRLETSPSDGTRESMSMRLAPVHTSQRHHSLRVHTESVR